MTTLSVENVTFEQKELFVPDAQELKEGTDLQNFNQYFQLNPLLCNFVECLSDLEHPRRDIMVFSPEIRLFTHVLPFNILFPRLLHSRAKICVQREVSSFLHKNSLFDLKLLSHLSGFLLPFSFVALSRQSSSVSTSNNKLIKIGNSIVASAYLGGLLNLITKKKNYKKCYLAMALTL